MISGCWCDKSALIGLCVWFIALKVFCVGVIVSEELTQMRKPGGVIIFTTYRE